MWFHNYSWPSWSFTPSSLTIHLSTHDQLGQFKQMSNLVNHTNLQGNDQSGQPFYFVSFLLHTIQANVQSGHFKQMSNLVNHTNLQGKDQSGQPFYFVSFFFLAFTASIFVISSKCPIWSIQANVQSGQPYKSSRQGSIWSTIQIFKAMINLVNHTNLQGNDQSGQPFYFVNSFLSIQAKTIFVNSCKDHFCQFMQRPFLSIQAKTIFVNSCKDHFCQFMQWPFLSASFILKKLNKKTNFGNSNYECLLRNFIIKLKLMLHWFNRQTSSICFQSLLSCTTIVKKSHQIDVFIFQDEIKTTKSRPPMPSYPWG